LFDRDALERLARDRTLESREATLTYSTHLTDHFQMVADATLARTSSSPGSAGVPAFGESGPDRFAGIQLIGTGFLREHAVWIAGLRSARYRLSDVHVLDLMSSFRVTPRFSIAPRLQFTDVDQSSDLGSARKLTPSLRFLYDVSRHAQIDANFGGNTIEQRYAGPAVIGRRREEAFIAYVGYRYLF
jgi:hypothetical protein